MLGILLDRLSAAHELTDADARAVLDLPMVAGRVELGDDLRRDPSANQCLLMVGGFAFRHRFVEDGGRQILGLYVPGDLIDAESLLLNGPESGVQAMTRVDVARIDRKAMFALACARPEVARALWRETLVDAAIAREWIASLGRRSARGRAAHLLCEMAVRSERAGLGERTEFELPMTQEQLGDALGLTAVHVNRTLRTLQEDGLVQRSKRSVAVGDWPALVSEAGFDPSYLHLPN